MKNGWIKIDHNLTEKTKYMDLQDALDLDDALIIGYLVIFWVYFDKHAINGLCENLTKRHIDRITCKGFADEMVKVGWLLIDENGASAPSFESRFDAIERKKKANAERQARYKEKKNKDLDQSVTKALPSVTKALPSVTEALPSVTEALPSVTEALPKRCKTLDNAHIDLDVDVDLHLKKINKKKEEVTPSNNIDDLPHGYAQAQFERLFDAWRPDRRKGSKRGGASHRAYSDAIVKCADECGLSMQDAIEKVVNSGVEWACEYKKDPEYTPSLNKWLDDAGWLCLPEDTQPIDEKPHQKAVRLICGAFGGNATQEYRGALETALEGIQGHLLESQIQKVLRKFDRLPSVKQVMAVISEEKRKEAFNQAPAKVDYKQLLIDNNITNEAQEQAMAEIAKETPNLPKVKRGTDLYASLVCSKLGLSTSN